ncbi:fimbrial biogenesis outer membrane usher protein [Jejubacter calystegiae]|uniref:Fimbrial biogenesis outer membrane usher protein n=1 Tax=Jejubacter calystegiae TaxID=2579935 RepID=A0A4V1G7B9_9ENTR|nr:fimbria/pilus outer membrane usher protein [Jejubacter calystegiae]QCT19107.1 fimbrial biogenesis outer membrane usher protein [Jejubacter calystegiae]
MKCKALIRNGLLVNSIGAALYSCCVFGESFNSSLLVGSAGSMDWNNQAMVMTPGEYEFDVYVNDEWKGKFPFKVTNGKEGTLQIQASQISMLDIRDISSTATGGAEYIDIDTLLHGGKSSLKPGEMRVNLEVPQAWVNKSDRNWVAPEKWDQGINGLYTNYNLNYYSFHAKQADYSNTDNIYLSLNSGLNLFGWHLIDNSTYMRYSNTGKGYWRNSTRYLERPFASLGAVLRIGDAYTSSEYFDSIRFRGVTLNKSRQMLPDREQVYMPVISGVANTASIVNVYQDGHVIYQITVPPGPFAIRDLMPTGSRSDLTVEVKNSGGGGNVETFVVPFSSIPDMLRPGTSDWRFNAGEVNVLNSGDDTRFMQFSYTRGMNNYWTLYSGLTASSDYQSWLAGSAVSIPWVGSVSGSMEQARYQLPGDEKRSGEKYTISWSKYLPSRTNITLASYYYRTQDYASFSDYIATKDNIEYYGYNGITRYSKQAFSATVSQPLGENYGRLSLTAYWRDYWNNRKSTKQYNLSYSNKFNSVNYTLSLRRSEYNQSYYDYDSYKGNQSSYLRSQRKSENSVYLSLTIPMSIFDSPGSISTRTSFQQGKYASTDLSVNGTKQDVDYSLVLTNDNDAKTRSADLYGSWDTSWSRLSGGLTEASDYRQMSMGASGSLLAWSGGVLASGSTGRSFVIVDAPGMKNATINGDSSVRTNASGKALVTNAVAYRQNNFSIDADEKQDSDVDLLGNIMHMAPYEGSITYLKYQTDTRRLFTLEARRENGESLPFGTAVLDGNGENLGYVSQGSQLYVKAEQMPQRLKINVGTRHKRETCVIEAPKEGVINVCR